MRVFACAFAALLCGTASAEIVISEQDAARCFAETERLNRLACYDALLNRPTVNESASPDEPSEVPVPQRTPSAIRFVESFLRSPDITTEGIAITLINRVSGEDYRTDGEPLLELLDPPRDPASFEAMRLETDLYLAMSSIQDIGEEGALLLSCENNITHMRIQWPEPLNARISELRFWFGEAGFGEGPGEVIGTRIQSEGYISSMPRGLESIRLLSTMVRGNRLQVSTGDGEDARSMFFDTEALRQALPMLARHCSWSVQSF